MKRVILADDHSFVRLGLIQILKDEYPLAEITQVGDGESLVREVTLHDWDIVISDLDMPGRSGLEALQQIKLIKPDLPVLILSIYTEDLYAVRVLKAGASGYMNKNAAPEELITAVQRILTGRKYITPEIAEKLLLQSEINKPSHEELSNREFEIFKLLAAGKTTTQIADELFLALTTVSTHRHRIMEKLGLNTNSELTRYAIANHILSDIS
ncbi:response regulator transcription factor [Ginsengibacter hankyongi]|uniref:Response regulator transcription factor n=1 Tax=Ginsengibacter hankyongi TaxID=2607284 RepID=A0A5J5IKY2_9BACT|nr:response regulator transcription factor [Ginsengibacter hankyongi]KAA9040494.1 response regulator transcription factor [Ginsengibacter hankyongi]